MLLKIDAKNLRDVVIPTLKAMKSHTQECRKRLEQLKREMVKALNR
jgi:hypothetical protein